MQALAGPPRQLHYQEPSGLPLNTLRWVAHCMCRIPAGFSLHPSLATLLQARR